MGSTGAPQHPRKVYEVLSSQDGEGGCSSLRAELKLRSYVSRVQPFQSRFQMLSQGKEWFQHKKGQMIVAFYRAELQTVSALVSWALLK